MMKNSEISKTIKVWDLPTRVFHWALLACIVGLLVSAQLGGSALAWHFRFGYGVLTLLLFRFIWGFAGGHWSRFSAFFYAPSAVLRYIKGEHTAEQAIGHNPLGAWSVLAMLLFLGLQVGAGLFTDDEISNSGPLVKFASAAWVEYATFYHKNIGKLIVLGLIGLHLAAITYHYFRLKDNLVTPMVKGCKLSRVNSVSSRDSFQSRLWATLVFVSCAALVAWLVA